MSRPNPILIARPGRQSRRRLYALLGLLLIALLCLQLGLTPGLNFAPRGVRGAKGERLIAAVQRLGGRVTGSRDSGGFHGLGNVELFRVDLYGTDIGDEDLGRLVGELGDRACELDLRGTRVTDAGLKHLGGLSRLAALSLGDGPAAGSAGTPRSGRITDDGLDEVARLAGLRELTLDSTSVTDEGLARLQPLSGLAVLTLKDNGLRGPGLAHLKGMKLNTLHLEEDALDEDELRHLAGLVRLQYLMLYRTTLRAKGLDHLKGLTGLVGLWLNGCVAVDDGRLEWSLPRTIIYR
jgi:hypothetical protein